MNNFFKRLVFTLSIILCYIQIARADTISNKQIKVGIIPEASAVTISTSANGTLYLLSNNNMNKIAVIEPRQACTITNKNGILEIAVASKKINVPRGKLILKNSAQKDKYTPLVFAGSRWYRGSLEIFPALKNNKVITIVNTLPLEEYLYGVVPVEMPSSWPIEALKTQAIAARTYVLEHLGQFAAEGFDVMPTTASQVYGGVEDETPLTNQAVYDTRGKVVTYNSKLISAFYSASAGGITESSLDAWGTEIPYLKSVQDFDQDSPRFSWFKTISNDDLQGIIKKEFNSDIGRVMKLSVLETTGSSRVKTLRIEGQQGYVDIDGKKFRFAAKLNSTFFRATAAEIGTSILNETPTPNLFVFSGRGWGHGAGMSQWGARYLAKTGKTCVEILRHYYPGTQVVDGNTVLAR